MQTTLLGLAIAFILALVAALVGPYFVDWNRFRPQFEAEATRVLGAPVRVAGDLDARLLPTPTLRLRSVVVGSANDLGKVRADSLDVEFSLGSLMRGEWRATELTANGVSLDLGLDAQGRIDWPASSGTFTLGSLSIDRVNLTGRIALHDATSHQTLELSDIAFSGDVRSLAGSLRGDGNFSVGGARYPFRVSTGVTPAGATRVHFNIDSAGQVFSAEVDGVLDFIARVPRFDGALSITSPAAEAAKAGTGQDAASASAWRLQARVKADPAAVWLDQLDLALGAAERALKFSGQVDARLGAAPLLHAVLSARQLDLDRFTSAAERNDNHEPLRLLPMLRQVVAALPPVPMPTQLELGAEQAMLGGRLLQNVGIDLRGDDRSWMISRLDLRAPGATLVSLTGKVEDAGPAAHLSGTLTVESADPSTLAGWLQGVTEGGYHSASPLRWQSHLELGPDRLLLSGIQAEIDGSHLEGRLALLGSASKSRFEAALKAERLDLDAATAFTRAFVDPKTGWPDEAELTLDIDRAVSAGQELHPFRARFGYGPQTLVLDQLQIGDPQNVTIQGEGRLDRINAVGRLALEANAASASQLAAWATPFSPAVAARLNAAAASPGPARLNVAFDLDHDPDHADRSRARAALDFDLPQLKGTARLTATPDATLAQSIDLEVLTHSQLSLETRLSAEAGAPVLTLLGLDGVMATGNGRMQLDASAEGRWNAPLQIKGELAGGGTELKWRGTTEPWTSSWAPNFAVSLDARGIDLSPLFDLRPASQVAAKIGLSSRVTLTGDKLTFSDVDCTIAGSRLRGQGTVQLDATPRVEASLGLDAIDLGPAFAVAIGAAGHEASEPLGRGLLKGWHGKIAFQGLRGVLPGGSELRPVSGAILHSGETLTLDDLQGRLGGGELTGNISIAPAAGGVAITARAALKAADGNALSYRGLKMPPGQVSMQATLAGQGRSAQALTGSLSGSGTVTLAGASIAGLNPTVFDVAIRASDSGQVSDDIRLRQIVDTALAGGSLPVASAEMAFGIRDGRLSAGPATIESEKLRATLSGGYDIPADQADLRAVLTSTIAGHPEIQLFAAGPPEALNRNVDVASLSSWLAVRAIDRETRRLDALERGEAPPAPSSAPPAPLTAVPATSPVAPRNDAPATIPRRIPPKPSTSAPSDSTATSGSLAPLPPAIEIRPAPGAVRPAPKSRAPLALTPPRASQSGF